jgi:hypothetical protein
LYFVESVSAKNLSRKNSLRKAIATFLEGKQFCDDGIAKGGETEELLLRLAPVERFLCRAYGRLASLPDESTAAAQAIEAGKRSVVTFEKLVGKDPNNFQYALDIAVAHDELAQSYRNTGKIDEATKSHERYRKVLKDLLARNGSLVSRVVILKEFLVLADYNLQGVYEADPVGRAAQIRELVNEQFDICEKLHLVKKESPITRIIHANACFAVAEYQEDDNEEVDLRLLLKSARMFDELSTERRSDPSFHSEGLITELLGMQIVVLQKIADELTARGKGVEAAGWRGRSLTLAKGKPELLFGVAVSYALSATLVGKLPTKLGAQQLKARRERYEHLAILMLKESVAAGFKDAGRLRDEPGFALLRSRPDFQAVLFDLGFPADPFVRP